jgi:hypothetical protein
MKVDANVTVVACAVLAVKTTETRVLAGAGRVGPVRVYVAVPLDATESVTCVLADTVVSV